MASSAFADMNTKATVVDNNGNIVRSIVSGECVRTKWDAMSDACGNAAPVPAAAPTKAAAPAKKRDSVMREQKRSYLVFFDFNKDVLNEDAKGIISNLLEKNSSDGSISFAVTGHADRSGGDAYNLALSKRRANAVKAALIANGVKEENISIDFKGESEPLVQTDDGIKEPQNRRAEIRVSTEVLEKR